MWRTIIEFATGLIARLPSRSRAITDEGDCLNTVSEQYKLIEKIRDQLTKHHTMLLAARDDAFRQEQIRSGALRILRDDTMPIRHRLVFSTQMLKSANDPDMLLEAAHDTKQLYAECVTIVGAKS